MRNLFSDAAQLLGCDALGGSRYCGWSMRFKISNKEKKYFEKKVFRLHYKINVCL